MADRDPDIRPGVHTERAERFISGGNFESIDDVVDAALDALERQEHAFNAMVREKVADALADPRPGVPLDEAFARLRADIEGRRRA